MLNKENINNYKDTDMYITEFNKNYDFNINLKQLFSRHNFKNKIKGDIVLKKYEQGLFPNEFIDILRVIFKYKILTIDQLLIILNLENKVSLLQVLENMYKEQLINSFTLSFENRFDNNKITVANNAALCYCIDNAGLILLSRHTELSTINFDISENYVGPALLSRILTINEIECKLKKYISSKTIKTIPQPKIFFNKNITYQPNLFVRIEDEKNGIKDYLFQKVAKYDMDNYLKELLMFLKLMNDEKVYKTLYKNVEQMPTMIFLTDDIDSMKQIEILIKGKEIVPNYAYSTLDIFCKDKKTLGTCFIPVFNKEKQETELKQSRIASFV